MELKYELYYESHLARGAEVASHRSGCRDLTLRAPLPLWLRAVTVACFEADLVQCFIALPQMVFG